ncbi:hypothetical protein [Streptomyces iconiensis]|uniref:Uncharacterized protein n=1 Tax=Streptomyces iconiensis TaxID=1384038 RepID=A0ABT7A4D9_9ACTN|nr:hypothetical protein [Streptomyces iconiensis]MDJ1136219.1 hypothetical protein [Streptomyces iconiensis]
MKHRIHAPVKEFTGVVAGVHFADGQAETENDNVVAYFLRQGYAVKAIGNEPQPEPLEPSGKPDDAPPDGKAGRTRSKTKEG